MLHKAEISKEELRFQDAIPALEQVIALEPNLPIAYLQLGTNLTALKEYARALPILRKAVELRPDDKTARDGVEDVAEHDGESSACTDLSE